MKIRTVQDLISHLHLMSPDAEPRVWSGEEWVEIEEITESTTYVGTENGSRLTLLAFIRGNWEDSD